MGVAAFPFNQNNLQGGATRILYAPITQAVPTVLTSVILSSTPYTAATGWVDVGATSVPMTYDQALTVAGYKIEQETTNLLEEPTEFVRTIKLGMAELHPANLQIVENAPTVTAVVAGIAASGLNASTTVGVGTVTDLTVYRVAFIAQKSLQQGAVVEATKSRGRFEVFFAYRASLTTNTASISYGKGSLAHAPLTLKLFPESGQPSGQDYGKWIDESAGTLP